MELLLLLCGVVGLMVLGSGWLIVSFWLAFKAGDYGEQIGKPVGWFFYMATVSSMLVGGVTLFGYVMSKVTGES